MPERGDIPTIPRATYRLQFNAGFTFADAEAVVPYLARLGISHVYASPFLKARTGSTHGYDITDHNALNPEIGDEAAFRAFVAALHRDGMGLIVDFVPNHMGIGKADNAWWLDVLAWGQASPYARYFDIDWQPAKPGLQGKLLVPLLGDHYGAVLEQGELALRFDAEAGTFHVQYHDHVFPIGPPHFARILVLARREADGDDGALDIVDELAREFMALRAGLRRARDRPETRVRANELTARLAAAARDVPGVARHIEACLDYFNGRPGDAGSFMALHRLLQLQPYRLAFWRAASDEINYRRFFDINELAGLRVEEPALFETIHRMVRGWIEDGAVQGLRIDHIDGLFDPSAYCRRLRALVPGKPFYLIVEKILGHGETLRRDWPVDGTTGYEAANLLNGVFVDAGGEERLLGAWRAATGAEDDFAEELAAAKREVMQRLVASELNVVAGLLERIAESNWRTRDFTLNGHVRALADAIVALPVYRTYVDAQGAAPADRDIIARTIRRARRASPDLDPGLFDFLEAVWTTDLVRRRRPGYSRRQVVTCAMKLQQLTGPVMAKAMEDTSFYRYVPLVSLNEVGGEPGRMGVSVDGFHAANRQRAEAWPLSMIATTTHDTKRGEDARARIDVLSEIPASWQSHVERWYADAAGHRREVDGRPAPSPNDEYLLYQTLIGAWPNEDIAQAGAAPRLPKSFAGRIQAYMVKAMREAKRETSWLSPDEAYEAAVAAFVAALLDTDGPNPFLDDFRPFVAGIARIGMLNGLAQTVLKFTIPGVPDIYQGAELWEHRLVDPDNRTPVDFAARRRALAELDGPADPAALLAAWPDGRLKLHATALLLDHRMRNPALYADGAYLPLAVDGPAARHLCAFARTHDGAALIVCVPRLMATALGTDPDGQLMAPPEVWKETRVALPAELAATSFTDVFSGRRVEATRDQDCPAIEAAALLETLPFAVAETGAPSAL